MQEPTEEEQRILLRGMRMLARMIARQHLARQVELAAQESVEQYEARTGPAGAGESGDEQC